MGPGPVPAAVPWGSRCPRKSCGEAPAAPALVNVTLLVPITPVLVPAGLVPRARVLGGMAGCRGTGGERPHFRPSRTALWITNKALFLADALGRDPRGEGLEKMAIYLQRREHTLPVRDTCLR